MDTSKNYDYAMIGNCTSAALIGPDCGIDWLCFPFFDSPSLFARILDEKNGGYFRISAVDPVKITQNYIPHTPILKTIFETKHGVFEVRDYMPRFKTSRQDYYCPSEIHRDILPISGSPKIIIELDPRPNYALGSADFALRGEYIKITSTKGEYNSFYLYSDLDHKKVVGGQPIELRGPAYFLLSYHEKLEGIDNHKVYLEYEKTKTYWLDWVNKTRLPPKYKEQVIRSFVTLKLLMYERTGAVIAAPTTSLPEIIGRDRNWDYRFCWIRDASMIVDLYARMGHMKSANRFIRFILNRMLLKHENIAVMYGINGEKELTEKTLDHLAGYESSRPVRIGNDAYRQVQNDLYGELIETIYTYFIINRRGTVPIDEEMWTVVRSLVNDVIDSWQQPDSGIWERREALRHYVHSKMMSWVALDRAVKIAQFVGRPDHAKNWAKLAVQIKEDILANGYNDQLKSFTMYYGSELLDASNLLMLHYGFLDRKDPRMVNTVRQAYEHLVKKNFVFRYTSEDEFGVPENAFIVCTFWMINALYLIGEEQKAREMLDNVLKAANRHGLLAEDVETATGRLTGNFPQGYSHLALIQSVFLLETDYNWSDAASLMNSPQYSLRSSGEFSE
jgi:GH15 family glucan-1,4-alpha-glucosidase